MKIHELQKQGENVPKHQCPHCSAFLSQKSDLGEYKGKHRQQNVEISRGEISNFHKISPNML